MQLSVAKCSFKSFLLALAWRGEAAAEVLRASGAITVINLESARGLCWAQLLLALARQAVV